jgi:hypothetical protein
VLSPALQRELVRRELVSLGLPALAHELTSADK